MSEISFSDGLSKIEHVAALFNPVTQGYEVSDYVLKAMDKWKPVSLQEGQQGQLASGAPGVTEQGLMKLGFPSVDFTGFDEARQTTGTWDSIWQGVKHCFGCKETVGDKLKDHVQSKMTADEKEKYEVEEKALAEYNRKVISWGTQMTLVPGPMPKPPDLPMHRELDRRVVETEKKILAQINGGMSDSDRARLDSQFQDYEKRVHDAERTMSNPASGPLSAPRVYPSDGIKDYYTKVEEATDKYLQQNA